MRHGFKLKKLNRTSSHRKAMFSNMVSSLVMHEQIITTLPKAKALRPILEKLVTLSKEVDLNVKRKLYSITRNKLVVDKLCDVLGRRYKQRPGGYLRIVKAGFRYGDMAPLAVIEFVERDESAKGKDYFNSNLEVQNEANVAEEKKSKTKKVSKVVLDDKADHEAKSFEKLNQEGHRAPKDTKAKLSTKTAGKTAARKTTARKAPSGGGK